MNEQGHQLEKVHIEPHCYFAIYSCPLCGAHGPLRMLQQQMCFAREEREVTT